MYPIYYGTQIACLINKVLTTNQTAQYTNTDEL